jgi:type I restriction enzyme S subunit
MLDLTAEQLRQVRMILAAHLPGREVRAFGSRARGNAKPHSDLDLALMGDDPLSDLTRTELLADFEESDLPFRVDLLAWRDAPPSLRAAIAREGFTVTPTHERQPPYTTPHDHLLHHPSPRRP